MSQDRPSHTKPSRLDVWGDSLLNKLPARTRRKRKREASKKRRVILKEGVKHQQKALSESRKRSDGIVDFPYKN